ncbi:MAG: hypothetical protein COA82_09395 [Alkaliphilus sp.]|nr:MAG: hypothetical protein COA82_09395 [Alkaliphilus sp.]
MFSLKNVVVQDSLVKVKEELVERGYQLVDSREGKRIDAIVYAGEYESMKSALAIGEMNDQGAVLINAKQKTIDDIVYIIEKRRYGNILK